MKTNKNKIQSYYKTAFENIFALSWKLKNKKIENERAWFNIFNQMKIIKKSIELLIVIIIITIWNILTVTTYMDLRFGTTEQNLINKMK